MKLYNLGNSIKDNRERLKLTQEKLAEYLDVSTHYIYELEKCGKTPSFSMMIKIADFFNTTIDDLLYGRKCDGAGQADELDELLKTLSPEKRKNLYKVICGLMPFLKL